MFPAKENLSAKFKKMKLYIKNMVCSRCRTTVKTELDNLGLQYDSLDLGEVTIGKKLTKSQRRRLFTALKQHGFELIDDQKNFLIEKLKSTITDLESCSDEDLHTSYSDFISLRVHKSFISLNSLFSEVKGITIEKYIIKQKIELVKEMLGLGRLNLAEIAVKMHYSSVAQLSSQFKSITGLTPSHFTQLRNISFNNPSIN